MNRQHQEESTSTIDQNISFYNEIAAHYDPMLEREGANKVIRETVAQKFTSIVPSGMVLDFGSGTGRDLPWLVKQGYSIICCEPALAMRLMALENHRRSLPHADVIFLEGEATDFRRWHTTPPFPGHVDAILSNFAVFNCIPDITLLFRNLSVVLKKGGNLVALILDKEYAALRFSPMRRFIASVSGKTLVMPVQYNDKHQMVYLHPLNTLKRASAPWFYFKDIARLPSGFSLIDLSKK